MINNEKLSELKIQPVGDGLIDLICPVENIETFIDLCDDAEIQIEGFSWWCHVTEGHEPCGMGGPKSVYFDGWFSEIQMDDIIRLADNISYREYFKSVWPKQNNYHKCWWPEFWIG